MLCAFLCSSGKEKGFVSSSTGIEELIGGIKKVEISVYFLR